MCPKAGVGEEMFLDFSTGNTVPLSPQDDAQNRDRATDLNLLSRALDHQRYSILIMLENFRDLNIIILIVFERDTNVVHP